MVLALHTVSGQISDVSPKTLQHPHFSKYLVPVQDGTKPYNKELYRGGTVEEKSKTSFSLFKKASVVEDEPQGIELEDEVTEEETQTEEEK
jgi:hypothetical protein